jgi:hypothetical protein
VAVEDLFGLGDLVGGDDRAGEVPLQEVLQPEEADLVPLAASALKVLEVVVERGGETA